MVEAVNYYCINVVVHHYIVIVLDNHMEGFEERAQFCDKVLIEKGRWNIQRLNQIEEEQYLGKNSFAYEMSRSCGEFYAELKQSLGFRPITWLFFK